MPARFLGACLVSTLVASALLVAQPPGPPDAPAIRLRAATFRPLAGERPAMERSMVARAVQAGRRGPYLVQATGPITESWKTAVAAAGAELIHYVPDFAFRVRMRPADAARVRQVAGVAWVGPFHPAYKLGPRLARAGTRPYLVTLEDDADPAAATAAVAANGIRVIRRDGRRLVVRADAGRLAGLARLVDVAAVDNVVLPRRHNDFGGGAIMGGATAHALGYTGATQIVAVADTGLGDGTAVGAHRDLPAGRVAGIFNWPGLAPSACFDAIVDDGPIDVDTGHGTHTSLSAVGGGDASGEGTGTAPGATLVFQAVENYAIPSLLCRELFGLTNGYYLTGLPADLRLLYDEAYLAGARIHSNSWGIDVNGDYTVESRDTDDYVWTHPDLTITFSAGNGGVDGNADGVVDLGSLSAPATGKNVIAVGASENDRLGNWFCDQGLGYTSCAAQGGQNSLFPYGAGWPTRYPANPLLSDPSAGHAGQMAAFSSRGPVFDGRIKPDVVAPGTWVLSGYADPFQEGYDPAANPQSGLWQYDGWGFPRDRYYKYMGGTSMASPLVAGGAAVVRDFYQQTAGIAASAALVKATLINTAVDLLDENNDGVDDNAYPIPNHHEGWGRVDLAAATGGGHQFVEEPAGLATGAAATFAYAVPGGTPAFKATLVWTDYPSATLVATTLVNDLDLVLTGPDGTVYRGNVFGGGWSVAGGVADRTNNVENGFVPSPAPGLWTVEVQAFNVPQGPQPFALVVDGGTLDGVPPAIINPLNGGTLAGTSVSFQWSANGADVTGWQLDVGAGPGGTDYFTSGPLPATTLAATVTGLPSDGSAVFARLSYQANGVWETADTQYTAVTITAPAITTPPPGSVLPGPAVTFQWSANGTPVTDWRIDVGTTPGGDDLYAGALLAAAVRSHLVTGLPTGGAPLFVRLHYTTDGAGAFSDHPYTAAAGPPAITTPTPGSVLPGPSALFAWTAHGTTVSGWRLELGTTFGGADLHNSGILSATTLSTTAGGLPVAGQPVYARLSYLTATGWQFTDAQYTAATLGPPAVTTPPPGSVLPGGTVTFEWTANGQTVNAWQLQIGSTFGGADLFNSGILGATTRSATAAGLPTAGQAVFARLSYLTASGWLFSDASYTAASVGPPTISDPPPGSVLPGATVLFQWTDNGTATNAWRLEIGSTFGGADLFNSGILGASTRSATVTGLPTGGQPLYTRLSYLTASGWAFTDVPYTAATVSPPALTAPPPGTVLPGSTVTFAWSAHGTAVTDWRLTVGTTAGAADLHDSGPLAAATLAHTVTGLPIGGQPIHVRLAFTAGGTPGFTDAQYVAAPGPPALTTPVPGTVLPGGTVPFTWAANGTPATDWRLDVGSSTGGADFYSSGTLPAGTRSVTASGLPTGGQPVFARLHYTSGGVPQFVDASYTAATVSQPALTAPAPGTVLPGATALFEWTAGGATVNAWQLTLGTTFGGSDLHNSGILGAAVLSATASGLPVAGQPVFARLSFLTASGWQFTDGQYTAATLGPPALTTPPPGSVLPGGTVTFDWTANGHTVNAWQLTLGSTFAGSDLHNSGILGAATRSATAGGLPTAGQAIFARLSYLTPSGWQFADVPYTAATVAAPVSVPDVIGLTRASAEAAIVAAGLAVGTVAASHSDTVPVDAVIAQSPAAGTAAPAATAVDLEVSLGPRGPALRTRAIQNVTTAWTRVTLDRTYDSMVVVCTPAYDGASVALVSRVRNAVGDGFDLRVERTDGGAGAVTGVAAHCLAAEAGVYTAATHGVTMEAVRFTSSVTDHATSWVGEPRMYAGSYTAPVVVGQVMSDADPDFSVFWARGASRAASPSSGALRVGKHVGEDPDRDRLDETLGYLVVEAGTGMVEGLPYTAGLGADTVRGMGDDPPYTYAFASPGAPATAVVSQAGMDGANGGWAVLYGPAAVGPGVLSLAIDEDQAKDAERRHTTEQVAYFVVGPAPAP